MTERAQAVNEFAASTAATPTAATPKGLRLRDGMSIDAWLALGRRLSGIGHASAWCLGDWLLFGQRAYGQRYKAALEATHLDYQTLRNYAWVARRFEPSRRRDKLSFQHHGEVAALPEPGQDLWLQRAERFGWSRNELRRHLAADRRSIRVVDDTHALSLRMLVTSDRERRWRTAAANAGRTLNDWLAATADAACDSLLEEPPAYGSSQPPETGARGEEGRQRVAHG